MANSGAGELCQHLEATCQDLRTLIADDPDAMVAATNQRAANDLVAQAVAVLSSDPVVAQLASGGTSLSPASSRPPVLARDLLISVDLACRALLFQQPS